MKSWKSLKKQILANPEVKVEYDKLGPEQEIARAIILARTKKRLTQADVAKKAGVSQVMIARLESGAGNHTVKTVSKVAKALNTQIILA